MICPHCGKVNLEDDTLCPFCGMPVVDVSPLSAIHEHSGDDSGPDETIYRVDDESGREWVDLRQTTGCRKKKRAITSSPAHDLLESYSRHDNAMLFRQMELSDREASAEHERVVRDDAGSVEDPGATIAPDKIKPPKSPDKVENDDECIQLSKVLDNRYDILMRLGSGGMASVWLARECALDRMVAIKVLAGGFIHDQAFVARFRREARIAAALEHPNIVRVYAVSDACIPPWFVMSYVPGGSVASMLENGKPLPLKLVLSFMSDIASALAYAHERGVIHRDLKPDNIMIDAGGQGILTDFGIAHASAGTMLTQAGQVLGTPQYMSPEQAMGETADVRSDIYAFGVLMYHMATGSLPFNADDAVSLMYMHVHQPPLPPCQRNPLIPVWLGDLIMRCMKKKPEERFASASEIKDALGKQKEIC